MQNSGILFIISAPSGTGKTSLVNELVKSFPSLKISISHTTRPKRAKEKDGINYYFVKQEIFDEMITRDEFLEHAKVFGQNYGTSKTAVKEMLRNGMDVILEIDWQGAQQIRKLMPNTVSIFILPPSQEILRERIIARDQDDAKVIEQRLKEARNEISHYNEYDYLIVNDNFDEAVAELKAIIKTQRCRQKLRSKELSALLDNLMYNSQAQEK